MQIVEDVLEDVVEQEELLMVLNMMLLLQQQQQKKKKKSVNEVAVCDKKAVTVSVATE